MADTHEYHEDYTSDSSEEQTFKAPRMTSKAATKAKAASHFTPKSINKRLIVLCDGTGQSSINADSKSYLTNITRISRALSPYAVVEPVVDAKGNVIGGKEIEQVVYYQSGVGTESGQILSGGLGGIGVSQNVRSAYSFLANNYIGGDQIYVFGFSRGAFTARLIAGMVTSLGVLTKRGMDSFPKVYEEYKSQLNKKGKHEIPSLAALRKNDEIHESARDAVQIVGMFDTVAFYAEGRLLPWMLGQQYNLKDVELSHRVKYGYHAIALDEERRSFRPTLWTKPKKENLDEHEQKKYRLKEMRQVWFSGTHSDIGGGLSDPRLSDIALAWMISRCSGADKLSFIDVAPYITIADGQGKISEGNGHYLLDPKKKPEKNTWATQEGSNMQSWLGVADMCASVVENFRHGPRDPPKKLATATMETEEYIHRSIVFRKMSAPPIPLWRRLWRYLHSMQPWGHDVSHGYGKWEWPCRLLERISDTRDDLKERWPIAQGSKEMIWEAATPADVKADKVEDAFRGCIRRLPLEEAVFGTFHVSI